MRREDSRRGPHSKLPGTGSQSTPPAFNCWPRFSGSACSQVLRGFLPVLEAWIDPDVVDVTEVRYRNEKTLSIRLGPAELSLGLAAMAVHHPGIRSLNDFGLTQLLRFPVEVGGCFTAILTAKLTLKILLGKSIKETPAVADEAALLKVARFLPILTLGVSKAALPVQHRQHSRK